MERWGSKVQYWSEPSSKLENLLRPTRSQASHSLANEMSDVVELTNQQFLALLNTSWHPPRSVCEVFVPWLDCFSLVI